MSTDSPNARVWQILRETAMPFRKGAEVEMTGGISHFWSMSPVAYAPPHLQLIDVHFFVAGVDPVLAARNEEELRRLLPQIGFPLDREISYIEAGGLLAAQDAALVLFAIGEVLGWWKVLTPEYVLGGIARVGPEAQAEMQAFYNKMAGAGFISVHYGRKEKA